MATGSDKDVDVLQAVWSAESLDDVTSDVEECSPQKVCRNMKDVTFDGFAPPGSDLGQAWRSQLAREGKLVAGSLRDLVVEKSGREI